MERSLICDGADKNFFFNGCHVRFADGCPVSFVFNPLGLGPEPRYLRNLGNEKLKYIRKRFEAHFSLVS